MMPVVEYVALPLLSASGVSRRMAQVRARLALERVDALSFAGTSTSKLSLGESVRVELARALAADPCLLLIDEPPVLRSPSEGKALYGLLKDLGEQPDLAVLIASEDLELVQKAPRTMAVGGGEVRLMSEMGRLLQLPTRQTGTAGRGKHR
jgi:ABC-type Mn2+/Zn2+ transport system ATPase subunit